MEKNIGKLGAGKLGMSRSGIFFKEFLLYNTAGKATSKNIKGLMPGDIKILFLNLILCREDRVGIKSSDIV